MMWTYSGGLLPFGHEPLPSGTLMHGPSGEASAIITTWWSMLARKICCEKMFMFCCTKFFSSFIDPEVSTTKMMSTGSSSFCAVSLTAAHSLGSPSPSPSPFIMSSSGPVVVGSPSPSPVVSSLPVPTVVMPEVGKVDAPSSVTPPLLHAVAAATHDTMTPEATRVRLMRNMAEGYNLRARQWEVLPCARHGQPKQAPAPTSAHPGADRQSLSPGLRADELGYRRDPGPRPRGRRRMLCSHRLQPQDDGQGRRDRSRAPRGAGQRRHPPA